MFKLFLFLCLLAVSNSYALGKDDFPELKAVGDLYLSFIEVDWFTAYETCRRNQMFLVSVLTTDDNSRIQVAAEDQGLREARFWTSGNDLGHVGDFSWFSKGNKLNEQLYHNWDTINNAVNATEESCIDIGINNATFSFTWKKQYCEEPQLFMCEEALCRKEEKEVVPYGLVKEVGDLYFSTFQTDWHTAFNFCRRNRMLLVSVETEQINRDIQTGAENQGRRNEQFWISGTNQKDEGEYVWLSIGRPLKDQAYLNWDAGQPDNVNFSEHCMAVFIGKTPNVFRWNDLACTSNVSFICVESTC